MRRWAAFLLRLYVAAACVYLLAPILIVVILAFSGEGYLHFPPTSLSLQWFARFFGDSQWQHALLSSLVIGAIACLVSTTVGFFAAYAFLRAEFSRQEATTVADADAHHRAEHHHRDRDVLPLRQAQADR